MKVIVSFVLWLALGFSTLAAEHTVEIIGFAFQPASLTVQAGDTVTWVNRDASIHTTTSTDSPAAWDSDLLFQTESFSVTFDAPGKFSYRCDVHPSMTGIVTVARPQTELKLITPRRLPDGQFQVVLTTSPGLSYVLQGSNNLTNWTSLSTNVAAASQLTVVDASATNFLSRLYRAFQLPE